jgi:putative CocE/NonD family hydrolase
MEITGPVRAVLWASSSAPDTDFMAKLVVVKADGAACNLVDGVIRTRFRDGFETEALMEPGRPYRLALDLWATSYLLAPGDRLRIDVTSSNYPRLARNTNTGAPFGTTTELVPAEQTIFVGGQRASHVVLPVVPG